MKLTLHIDDEHLPAILELLVRLHERTVGPEPDPEDPTRRDLPMPEGLVLPRLPKGKKRWVYRGYDIPGGFDLLTKNRHVMYLNPLGHWNPTWNFGGTAHHIEAI